MPMLARKVRIRSPCSSVIVAPNGRSRATTSTCWVAQARRAALSAIADQLVGERAPRLPSEE